MTDFVVAEAGIRQLHARYTDAVWRQDSQAFARCFAEDGEWRISGRVMRGRAEIAESIEKILSNFNRVLISFRTPILSVGAGPEAGNASGRTYVDEKCAWKNGETNISIGCYYERFVDVDGEWLFQWRLFEMFYRGADDMINGTWYQRPDYGPPPAMPPLDANTEDMAGARWGMAAPSG